jgi:hypothetical protein
LRGGFNSTVKGINIELILKYRNVSDIFRLSKMVEQIAAMTAQKEFRTGQNRAYCAEGVQNGSE